MNSVSFDRLRSSGPWLNPPQAVRYLRLPSLKALYQAVRRGQIPVHRLGKRLRFNRTELDRILDTSAAQ
jgi:excisionase family DNA binding protein